MIFTPLQAPQNPDLLPESCPVSGIRKLSGMRWTNLKPKAEATETRMKFGRFGSWSFRKILNHGDHLMANRSWESKWAQLLITQLTAAYPTHWRSECNEGWAVKPTIFKSTALSKVVLLVWNRLLSDLRPIPNLLVWAYMHSSTLINIPHAWTQSFHLSQEANICQWILRDPA